MKTKLIAQILAENSKVQEIKATDEPALLEGGYERLQMLVWDLKQTDYNSTLVNRVWPRLVDIGNHDLRKMRGHHQKTVSPKAGLQEKADYLNMHSQLKERINQTILALF